MASKYGVYQEIFSFSEAVKQRYRSDLIMNPVLTIFIVIMPLLVYMLVMAMSKMHPEQHTIFSYYMLPGWKSVIKWPF